MGFEISLGPSPSEVIAFVEKHNLYCFKCKEDEGPWRKCGTNAYGPWAVCEPCARGYGEQKRKEARAEAAKRAAETAAERERLRAEREEQKRAEKQAKKEAKERERREKNIESNPEAGEMQIDQRRTYAIEDPRGRVVPTSLADLANGSS